MKKFLSILTLALVISASMAEARPYNNNFHGGRPAPAPVRRVVVVQRPAPVQVVTVPVTCCNYYGCGTCVQEVYTSVPTYVNTSYVAAPAYVTPAYVTPAPAASIFIRNKNFSFGLSNLLW